MKTKHRHSARGSVLISAAMIAGIFAILIAGFLVYMSNEYNLNVRAHRWNQAFHLAESGVEVGLAEYNYPYTLGSNGFSSANGWSSSGGTYTRTVSNLTDTSGNSVGTFSVTASGVGTSNPKFTAIGTVTSGHWGGSSVARAVSVSLASASSSLFPFAIVSKSPLSFGGG